MFLLRLLCLYGDLTYTSLLWSMDDDLLRLLGWWAYITLSSLLFLPYLTPIIINFPWYAEGWILISRVENFDHNVFPMFNLFFANILISLFLFLPFHIHRKYCRGYAVFKTHVRVQPYIEVAGWSKKLSTLRSIFRFRFPKIIKILYIL